MPSPPPPFPLPPQAAVEEGIVPGGGAALLHASKHLAAAKEQCENFDQTIGVQIVEHAIKIPCKTIANNAGKEAWGCGDVRGAVCCCADVSWSSAGG